MSVWLPNKLATRCWEPEVSHPLGYQLQQPLHLAQLHPAPPQPPHALGEPQQLGGTP